MPLTVDVRAMLLAVPLQIVCGEGLAVAAGKGVTVTVSVIAAPTQLLAVGVMVYIAVPGLVPVAVNVWAMVDPEPAVPPLTPDITGAVQA